MTTPHRRPSKPDDRHRGSQRDAIALKAFRIQRLQVALGGITVIVSAVAVILTWAHQPSAGVNGNTIGQPKRVNVYCEASNPHWQPSGEVKKGWSLVFHTGGYSRVYQSSDGTREGYVGPEGEGEPALGAGFLAPWLTRMGLVGRIGNSLLFNIGDGEKLVCPVSGTLFVGINDTNLIGGCADNAGGFNVVMDVVAE